MGGSKTAKLHEYSSSFFVQIIGCLPQNLKLGFFIVCVCGMTWGVCNVSHINTLFPHQRVKNTLKACSVEEEYKEYLPNEPSLQIFL